MLPLRIQLKMKIIILATLIKVGITGKLLDTSGVKSPLLILEIKPGSDGEVSFKGYIQ